MDTPKPPQKPNHLLDDLESIREFLSNKEPATTTPLDELLDLPLLTDSVEMGQIPLLSEIVDHAPAVPPRPGIPAAPAHTPPPAVARPDPSPTSVSQTVQRSVETSNTTSDLLRLDGELRAAAQLILQDVIDDFVPQIEAELKRRLEARLTRLLPQRKT